MVSTDPVWHYFPPWMLWQNRGMWSRRNSVCSESSPKAFDMSSGITKLPITSWSVDNIYNRVLCCKSISINYNMHGWFLCWYHATGWVWWKSGLRAVAMWSSSSFTKTLGHASKYLVLCTTILNRHSLDSCWPNQSLLLPMRTELSQLHFLQLNGLWQDHVA